MKYRIIENSNGNYQVLLPNGKIYTYVADTNFSNLNPIEKILQLINDSKNTNGEYAWDKSVADMSDYDTNGTTIAYISDKGQLVINNFEDLISENKIQEKETIQKPADIYYSLQSSTNSFAERISSYHDYMKKIYMTAEEYAKNNNKSVEQIKIYCRQGRLDCIKKGNKWYINPNSPLPNDRRKKK